MLHPRRKWLWGGISCIVFYWILAEQDVGVVYPLTFGTSVGYIKCTATTLPLTSFNESGWLSVTSWMSFMWFTRPSCILKAPIKFVSGDDLFRLFVKIAYGSPMEVTTITT